jgi:single-strand DNA-binding protein
MPNFNSVTLVGHVTRDIELRYSKSNLAVTTLGLAVNDRVKRGEKWEDEASFFDVTVFGKSAEFVGKYVVKGSPVLVHGRLKLEQWEKDGQKRSKVVVIAEKVELLGGKGGQSRDETNQESPPSTDTYSQAPEPNQENPADIPF